MECPIPENEDARQDALNKSLLLHADPKQFDVLTAIARSTFDVPIALVSLIDGDRQFFLSHDGIDATESPRNTSFCGHVLHEPDILVIEDALQDERFRTNPFVLNAPNVRFYAGVPVKIRGDDGNLYSAGSFCVIDDKPRSFGSTQRETLKLLGMAVEREIQLTRSTITCPLTGLLNRNGLHQVGEKMIAAAQRGFKSVSAIFFDLNGLKAINDGPGGHKAGDAAIVGFADCLKSVSRKSDAISHVSGDEYVALMAGATADGARELCDRLDAELRNYNSVDRGYTLSYSAGIATLKPHQSLQGLISEADKLMYVDKAKKRALRKVS